MRYKCTLTKTMLKFKLEVGGETNHILVWLRRSHSPLSRIDYSVCVVPVSLEMQIFFDRIIVKCLSVVHKTSVVLPIVPKSGELKVNVEYIITMNVVTKCLHVLKISRYLSDISFSTFRTF